jgi:formylglycine-generating enzyme required for sulfatase activity
VADVFISYKREERQAVERLALELRKLNLDVWFDASLNAGEAFSDEIDREAHAAKAILVCWSPTARESQWVKSEALIGFEQRKLAACYVAGPDGCYPPTPFNSIHAEDLRAWMAAPSNTHAGFKSVLRRIGALCGRADIESYGALDVQAPASVLRAWIERHQSSPLFMVVDALLSARDAEEADRARLEQEARERRAREEAERQAREEAARRAREEQERRERAEREERARQQEAETARDEEAGRLRRRTGLIVGGCIVAAVAVALMVSARQVDWPTTAPQSQEPAATAYEPAVILSAGQNPAELAPLTPFKDCAECPDMIAIPGQTFAAGRFEVTFEDWDACVAGGGCNGYSPGDEGWGRAYRPVINVSWDDAQAYVQWLSQRTGQTYRLLTEAEWEIAARAGSTTDYSWGDQDPVCDQSAPNGANFSDCPYRRTTPRGSFQPNAFGLYDVHGNVWEWVEDCYDPDCSIRVIRGGSWYNIPQGLRSANRSRGTPASRNDDVGFRVARTL